MFAVGESVEIHDAVAGKMELSDLVDLTALAGWMDTKGLGRGPLENAGLLGGGTQNILLRFDRAGRAYVLRRGPVSLRASSNETMRREMRLLAALAGSAVPHPGFIAGCPEENVIGVSFYLMEPVDGFNATVALHDYHRADPKVRHAMGLSLADGISALAAVDYQAVGLAGYGKIENFLERQVPRWRSHLASYQPFENWPGPSGLPNVDKVSAWLEANRPPMSAPGIIHGDYHLANVMFENASPKLAAIIDWELSTLGDPLLDLGWVLATWPEPEGPEPQDIAAVLPWDGFPRPGELIERYRSRSSRDLTNIRWYAVLACFKLAIIIEGTYARACAGQAKMGPASASTTTP